MSSSRHVWAYWFLSQNPGRPWKYDNEQTEFFVEHQQKVTIRRTDVEMHRRVEATGVEGDAPMAGPSQRSLMDIPAAASAPGSDAPDPSLPKKLGDFADCKDQLEKFLDSLHKKAAQATGWMISLEPPAMEAPNDRQKQNLD